ncbi:NAD(P)-dependent oxidoreductase [Hominifimenecus sp. rT4P-3]|uniref:NAD(P)-dependent oxidoreductase n=1 Tax=Hominifimenecus sp. rT4P-3 TaxID=3242979 RepID=UPI003DA2B374
MKKIAWIGTGVMGSHQAGHLVKAGYPVKAYSRRPEKVKELAEIHGFIPCPTIREAVFDADVIFVMVGYPKDVEDVFLSETGILACAKPGAIAVDMTTSLPSLAERLYTKGKEKGIQVLDAPVSGGDRGAQAGTLSIMVGGERSAFDEVLPLFSCMGKTISYMGPAGFGQHTKAANQIAVAGATAAYTEAIAYAERTGLDPEKMLAAISGGAAGSWQITNMAPRALQGDFAPGFYIKHFIKDMKIIEEESTNRGLHLKMLEAVLALYQEMEGLNKENEGTQALIQLYR